MLITEKTGPKTNCTVVDISTISSSLVAITEKKGPKISYCTQ